MQRPQNPSYLLITGTDLGNGGKVRVSMKGRGTSTLPCLLWKKDGTEILLDVPAGQVYQDITIETPSGKLCYDLSGQSPNLILGPAKVIYPAWMPTKPLRHPTRAMTTTRKRRKKRSPSRKRSAA